MAGPFHGVWAKLERANEHLAVMQANWDAFGQSKPHGFPVHVHHDATYYEIWMEVRTQPCIGFSILAGEIIHQLRSALDHLVWILVGRCGNKPPGKHTGFPIYSAERDWLRDVERRSPKRRGFSPLHGLDPRSDEWALVKRYQPYNRGHCADALDTLNQFWNADKHRTLYTTFAVPDVDDLERMITWNPDADLVGKHITLKAGEPLIKRTKVAWLRFASAQPNPQVDVKGDYSTHIAFRDREGDSGSVSLAAQKACVSEIVRQAEAIVGER